MATPQDNSRATDADIRSVSGFLFANASNRPQSTARMMSVTITQDGDTITLVAQRRDMRPKETTTVGPDDPLYPFLRDLVAQLHESEDR